METLDMKSIRCSQELHQSELFNIRYQTHFSRIKRGKETLRLTIQCSFQLSVHGSEQLLLFARRAPLRLLHFLLFLFSPLSSLAHLISSAVTDARMKLFIQTFFSVVRLQMRTEVWSSTGTTTDIFKWLFYVKL